MNYKIEGIVLRSRDIKECDRLYTVFSRELGKISALAVGVRKATAKLASGLEPVTLSEIFLVKSRWVDKVTGTIIIDQFSRIKKNEQQLVRVKRIFEIIDLLLSEKETSGEIFDDLAWYLGLLNKGNSGESGLELLRLGLIWKIINQSGFAPALSLCPKCGSKISEKDHYWFVAPLGIQCAGCESGSGGRRVKIVKDAVKLLRIFHDKKLVLAKKIIASKEVTSQIEKVIIIMLEEVLDRKIYL